jgi:hypothetical protein
MRAVPALSVALFVTGVVPVLASVMSVRVVLRIGVPAGFAFGGSGAVAG